MTKIRKIQNKILSDSVFGIFPILDSFVSAFVSVRGAAFGFSYPWRLCALAGDNLFLKSFFDSETHN
jgi:hypothetical protein